jgi:TonB family protein
MKKNGNRILTYALALSLVIHFIFAAICRPIRTVEAHEETPTTVRIAHIQTPPPPTPRPTRPPKAPQKPASPIHESHPNPPKTSATSGPGPTEAKASPGPADASPQPGPPAPSASPGTPEPTPTPKPACSLPNAPATTIDVVTPTVPESAGDVGDVQAQVRVTLQPSGSVESVEVYRTAGNPVLDREALRAARQSTYRAEIRDCIAVRGQYLFTVDFKE